MSANDFVWGSHVVSLLVKLRPHQIRQVFIDEKHKTKYAQTIALLNHHAIALEWCSKKQLDQWLTDKPHQGIAAKVHHEPPKDQAWLLGMLESKKDPLLVILDEVQDPHNLGAILRSACAFGVDAVIATVRHSAPLSAVARKVASGGDLFVPYVQVTNLGRCLETLKERGIWTVGTCFDEKAKPIAQTPLKGPLALVMGAEGKGLRQSTKALCDFLAYVPMDEAMESLNVSVASGICLYQCYIQRTN